jgi:hypothetical protein
MDVSIIIVNYNTEALLKQCLELIFAKTKDISKIKHLLGFQPKYTFEQGIQKFVDWVNQQNIQNDKYDTSIGEIKKGDFINMRL